MQTQKHLWLKLDKKLSFKEHLKDKCAEVNFKEHFKDKFAKVNFKEHLKDKFAKVNRGNGVLRKLSGFLPRHSLTTIYKSLHTNLPRLP